MYSTEVSNLEQRNMSVAHITYEEFDFKQVTTNMGVERLVVSIVKTTIKIIKISIELKPCSYIFSMNMCLMRDEIVYSTIVSNQ